MQASKDFLSDAGRSSFEKGAFFNAGGKKAKNKSRKKKIEAKTKLIDNLAKEEEKKTAALKIKAANMAKQAAAMVAAQTQAPVEQRSKAPLIIGVGLAFAFIVLVGVVMKKKKETE